MISRCPALTAEDALGEVDGGPLVSNVAPELQNQQLLPAEHCSLRDKRKGEMRTEPGKRDRGVLQDQNRDKPRFLQERRCSSRS